MGTFQGHKNWNHWNVSLWINNDEALYRMAMAAVRHAPTKDEAARVTLARLQHHGITKTPDGAPYSISAIRAAMVEM